jgi:hypothetical protein
MQIAPKRIPVIAVISWMFVAIAAFFVIAWFPTDPASALGDFSFLTPTIAATIALLWSALGIFTALPYWPNITWHSRLLVSVPFVLAVSVGAVVIYRT